MDHSYFKEPTGLFKTLEGFSMGDNSAVRGSELILRIYELNIFKELRDNEHGMLQDSSDFVMTFHYM